MSISALWEEESALQNRKVNPTPTEGFFKNLSWWCPARQLHKSYIKRCARTRHIWRYAYIFNMTRGCRERRDTKVEKLAPTQLRSAFWLLFAFFDRYSLNIGPMTKVEYAKWFIFHCTSDSAARIIASCSWEPKWPKSAFFFIVHNLAAGNIY